MKALTEDQYWTLNHFITCGWDCYLTKEEEKCLSQIVTLIKGEKKGTFNIKQVKQSTLLAYYKFESEYYQNLFNALHSDLTILSCKY